MPVTVYVAKKEAPFCKRGPSGFLEGEFASGKKNSPQPLLLKRLSYLSIHRSKLSTNYV